MKLYKTEEGDVLFVRNMTISLLRLKLQFQEDSSTALDRWGYKQLQFRYDVIGLKNREHSADQRSHCQVFVHGAKKAKY